MLRVLLSFPLALFFCVRNADAGQVLKYSEEGTREGKTYSSVLTLSAAPEGIRLEAAVVDESGSPKTFVFLYSAKNDTVYPVDPPTGPVISAATIEVAAERARASGHRRKPGSFTVTPLHTTNAVGGWTCSAWTLRRPGQTTEIVCLADPAAVGVDVSTRANLRRMGALFVILNAIHLAEGDFREGFNIHALDQGFPVRELRSRDGVVEMDSQLVSVRNVEISPDLFRVPEPPAPAAPRAAVPAPTSARDLSMSLEGWALRGMPDPGRPWTGADYDVAADLLEAVAKEDAARLPHESSAVSGRLFAGSWTPATSSPSEGPGRRTGERLPARASSRARTGSA